MLGLGSPCASGRKYINQYDNQSPKQARFIGNSQPTYRGTTCTSQSAPYTPLVVLRSLPSPSGPRALVTSTPRTPFLSPVCRYRRKSTDTSMYSRSATVGARVVPVTSFMIQGTIKGASVHDGCAVPPTISQHFAYTKVEFILRNVMNHPSLTLSTIFLTTSKCHPWP